MKSISHDAPGKMIVASPVICLLTIQVVAAQHPILHLSFDDARNVAFEYGRQASKAATKDAISGASFKIGGMAEFVPGVKGSALKFDGFTTYVDGLPESHYGVVKDDGREEDDDEEFKMPREITVEAWIALGAYPWNWAPLITIGKYRITGFYLGVDSRGRLGFHISDATSVWHECNSNINSDTQLGLPLREWCHVVGTYSPEEGLAVYINGELAETYDDFEFNYGIAYSEIEDGFRIGRNRVDLPPSDPIRDWATYPSQYSFDGIIDELKIHPRALTAAQVSEIHKRSAPNSPPPLEARRFPSIPNSGRFSANYTRLKYYAEWDNLWPVGDHLDVVVQFDEHPTKLVFWRGTRFSPCWVTENGKWMADQSRETGSNWFLSDGPRDEMPTGCIEHMSDTQCRSSRVQVIENNDARCVVNWRYLQMDVRLRQQEVPNDSGFGQWGNEYYYVYPDGVAVRKLLPGYGGWQETIFLNEPGTRPEDNVELAACTLLNMRGDSQTYSWEDGYPKFDLDDAVIQVTNLKANFKPFMIFRESGGFEVFNLEVRPEYSHFPWWNHWPVAQIISDGRSANASDRASHSSLSWGDPGGEAALYGMTDQPAQSLVALARSWNYPPGVEVVSGNCTSHGYDYTQRAYLLAANSRDEPIELDARASKRSPLANVALVVEGWESPDVGLTINGEPVERGRDYRSAIEYDVTGTGRWIGWFRVQATGPTHIVLTPPANIE